MHSIKALPAILALSAGLVSGQRTCTRDIEISEPNPSFDCIIIDADVTVSEDLSGPLTLNGIERITGDLIVRKAGALTGISSTSLEEIEGTFELHDLSVFSDLSISSLRTVGTLNFTKLPAMTSLAFGTEGLTDAKIIEIVDTQISDLSGIQVSKLDKLYLGINSRLNSFTSDLEEVGELTITDNGNNVTITLENLETAKEIQLRRIASFDVPSLTKVNQSIKFDQSPSLRSFEATNLTNVGQSVTFINNKELTEVSFPALEKIEGDMTILNNTKLADLDGFPELTTVFGAIKLGGDFETVDLPKIDNLRGLVTITSSTDISDFCKFFNDAKDKGIISTKASKCTFNNEKANEGSEDGDTTSESDDGNSNDNNDDDEGAAGIVGVNMAMLGLAAFVGAALL